MLHICILAMIVTASPVLRWTNINDHPSTEQNSGSGNPHPTAWYEEIEDGFDDDQCSTTSRTADMDDSFVEPVPLNKSAICVICFEPLGYNADLNLEYCKRGCGKWIHTGMKHTVHIFNSRRLLQEVERPERIPSSESMHILPCAMVVLFLTLD